VRWVAAALGLAVVSSGLVVSASPASASPDGWESQSGIYHYFTVPKSIVPSQTCGNSTGAGAELEGNIGPSGTWAAVGLDASGQNCMADIGPMKPGLYYYQYVAPMADRSKQVFRNPASGVDVTSHPNWNTLFVPGPEVAWMDDVAAGGGTMSDLAYQSGASGSHSVMVWTPPSYDPNRAKPYPVLYLLDDAGQSYREWQELGRAKQILDNLSASGDLASMLVVMADPGATDYRAEVLNRIVPAVEGAYNVIGTGDGRAVAGIGRGASQALGFALSDPGAFGAIGSMSGYLPSDVAITAPLAKAVNKGTDLIRFYVGNTLDPSYNATRDAMLALTSAGVKFQFDGVDPKTGAVWDTWRENLRDFASRVFQPGSSHDGFSAGHRALTEPYTPPATGSITTPDIDANGMVTFETGTQWANAKDVVLWGDWAPNGQWFRIPLTKVGDRWRTTIGPIDGYYYWRYEVNGTAYHDPQDTQNTNNVESQLFVPGGVRTPLLADVPANESGAVATLQYASAYPGNPTMSLKVWTPPDYDPNRAEKYPVLYLYHGMGQNFASWTEVGRAAQILDNLYARGEIAPMVVVMPGYPGISDFWNDLSSKVIPFAQSTFNISHDPSEMALAGLSWGARGTQGALVNHPGTFSAYGIFSPPFASGSLNDTSGPVAKAGTTIVDFFAGDLDSGAVNAIAGMETNLGKYGIPTVKTIVPGPHGFDVWWQGLSDFLPRIFEHGLTIRQGGADFGQVPEGYAPLDPKKLTVTNTESETTGVLSVSLSGPDADKFSVSTDTLASIRAGKKADIRVTAAAGLPAGIYQATVVVAGDAQRVTCSVRLEVTPA